MREITARSNGWPLDYRRRRLRHLVNGWVGYFRLADMSPLLARLGVWLRRRVRSLYWKLWRRVRTRARALMRLGIPRGCAIAWAHSRKGCWRLGKTRVLCCSLTNDTLRDLGWAYFSERYELVRC